MSEPIIEMRCIGHVNEGATRRNPGEVIRVEGALMAGKLMRAFSAVLIDDSDATAVRAALEQDNARMAKAAAWRRE